MTRDIYPGQIALEPVGKTRAEAGFPRALTSDQGRVGSESDQQTGRHNSRNWLLAFSVGALSGATPNNIKLLNQCNAVRRLACKSF